MDLKEGSDHSHVQRTDHISNLPTELLFLILSYALTPSLDKLLSSSVTPPISPFTAPPPAPVLPLVSKRFHALLTHPLLLSHIHISTRRSAQRLLALGLPVLLPVVQTLSLVQPPGNAWPGSVEVRRLLRACAQVDVLVFSPEAYVPSYHDVLLAFNPRWVSLNLPVPAHALQDAGRLLVRKWTRTEHLTLLSSWTELVEFLPRMRGLKTLSVVGCGFSAAPRLLKGIVDAAATDAARRGVGLERLEISRVRGEGERWLLGWLEGDEYARGRVHWRRAGEDRWRAFESN